MVVVYTFGLGGYTGGCIYWYWVPVYMATGSWANTSNLAGKAKQSTTPQRLFGIWDSLKSQVWHSKFRLSNPAKNSTNTQRWTTTLPWQSLYRQVWSSISSLFFFFESTFSTGGIKVFLIEQKFTKSCTAQLNIEKPSSNQSSCLFLVTQLCSQAPVHQLNCPRLGAMDGGRDAGRFFVKLLICWYLSKESYQLIQITFF